MQFTFVNPTKIHFGENQITQISNEIPKDAKVLITYGGGSIKKNGVYDQVVKALDGYNWGEFSGIEPNPQYDTLMKCVELIKAEGYNYLLSVGGGSTLDGTKFISLAAKLDDGIDAWDIMIKGISPEKSIPVASVMTLPATGSETNIAFVVSRGEDKRPMFNPLTFPKFSILDPQTTLSLPKDQIANGIVDSFVHVTEQYITKKVAGGNLQDEIAEGILRTLIKYGKIGYDKPENIEARTNIMWSATMALHGDAGMQTGMAQDWTTHFIGHELTALYHIPHGKSLTSVWSAVMNYKRDVKEEKLVQFAERVWGITTGSNDEKIDQAIAKTVEFFKSLDCPTSLSEANINNEKFDQILAGLEAKGFTAMGENQDITLDDTRAILTKAL